MNFIIVCFYLLSKFSDRFKRGIVKLINLRPSTSNTRFSNFEDKLFTYADCPTS